MFPHSRPRANIERLVIRAPGCIVDCSIVDRDLRANLLDHLRRTSEFVLVCSSFNAVTPTFEWLNCLLQKMSRVQLLDIAIDEADPQVSDISQANLPHAHLRKLERLSLQLPECKGPSAPRLTKLGVDPYFFDQNLNNFHNWTNDHVLPFLAYIKPYSRRRVFPPASVASADSDSDDSYTTWSELSSLSGSSSGSLSSLPDLSSFASVGSGNAPCSSGVSSSSPTVSIPVSNGPISRHDRLASPPQPMSGSSTLSIAAPGSGSTILAHNQDSAGLHSPLVTFARAVAGLADDANDSDCVPVPGGSSSSPAPKRMRMAGAEYGYTPSVISSQKKPKEKTSVTRQILAFCSASSRSGTSVRHPTSKDYCGRGELCPSVGPAHAVKFRRTVRRRGLGPGAVYTQGAAIINVHCGSSC
ncbi:unnamed protein product, partial [Tilletia caries]